jgi:hypothetical protein
VAAAYSKTSLSPRPSAGLVDTGNVKLAPAVMPFTIAPVGALQAWWDIAEAGKAAAL